MISRSPIKIETFSIVKLKGDQDFSIDSNSVMEKSESRFISHKRGISNTSVGDLEKKKSDPVNFLKFLKSFLFN